MGTFRLGAIAVVMAVLVVVLLFGMPLRAWTNG